MTPEIRIFDTAGERQPLPDRFVLGWDIELLERGGCGSFSSRRAARKRLLSYLFLQDLAIRPVPRVMSQSARQPGMEHGHSL